MGWTSFISTTFVLTVNYEGTVKQIFVNVVVLVIIYFVVRKINFKKKYSSIYNIVTLMINGFKNVFHFSSETGTTK